MRESVSDRNNDHHLFLERDMWKQKYLMEKKKTLALEERARASAVS